MSADQDDTEQPTADREPRRAAERRVEAEGMVIPKTASILPLLVLYQRAWELTQSSELSLARLAHAAEAAALADAVCHLLAEAGDEAGHVRWAARLSEARHWVGVIHDALSHQEGLEEINE
ncbi:MAG: hypothetical protein AB1555_17240 [Nitrospirota bacterium]